MDALRIAICEDMDADAEHLRSLIESSGIAAEITRFGSGGAFLSSRPAGRFDLVFFDIYMGEVSGVEAARVLREADEGCGVVFTTTSEEHRAEAFDVDAEQYLVKPVDRDRLDRVLKKRLSLLEQKRNICTVNAKGQRMDIHHDNIYYVEVYNHNCLVHTSSGVIDTGSTMAIEDFVPLLPPPRFMRCHQSYIVNLSYVDSVGRDFTMKNGNTVYIRRGLLAKCKNYLFELDKWRIAEAGREDA
jgi:DNA-binding LytR/AlgR family response regulator